MNNERRRDVLGQLCRIPPAGHYYFRGTGSVLREVDCPREELAEVIGSGVTCGHFHISFAHGDHVKFERIARSSPPAGVPSDASPSPPAPAFQSGPDSTFDANEVGKRAQEYQIAEQKSGREVSATDAVAHVLQRQATTPQGTREAETAANDAKVKAQIAEVFERRYGKRR
jgi:hypothetical protein